MLMPYLLIAASILADRLEFLVLFSSVAIYLCGQCELYASGSSVESVGHVRVATKENCTTAYTAEA